MTPIIIDVNLFKDCDDSMPANFSCTLSDSFNLDSFEDRFNGVVVITIILTVHRNPIVVFEKLLIDVLTLLAFTKCVMDAAFRQ